MKAEYIAILVIFLVVIVFLIIFLPIFLLRDDMDVHTINLDEEWHGQIEEIPNTITITLPTTCRDYIHQFLQSFSHVYDTFSGKYKYTFILSSEPSEKFPSILSHVQDLFKKRMNIVWHQNQYKKGVSANPYQLLDYAFRKNSKFNVHLEDDLIVSPYLFQVIEFYYENFHYRPASFFCYGLFTYKDEKEAKEIDFKILPSYFNGLGWCAFKENWNRFFKPFWFDPKLDWDWSITAHNKKQSCLIPNQRFTNHIGIIGEHCGEDKESLEWQKDTFLSHTVSIIPLKNDTKLLSFMNF